MLKERFLQAERAHKRWPKLNKLRHKLARILTEALHVTVSIYRYREAIKAKGTTLHGADNNSNGYDTTLHAIHKNVCKLNRFSVNKR